MAAESIAASVITPISSVAASSQDSDLRIADFWIDDTFETGDWITASNLGVSKIRGVLGVSSVKAGTGAWNLSISLGDLDLRCESRAKLAHDVAGSSAITASTSIDEDNILINNAFSTDTGMWIQLLVEA